MSAHVDRGRPLALVTGATRGLGRAIAHVLSSDHHVLVGGRDPASVDSVVAELDSAQPFIADLTDSDAVKAAVERELGPDGRLDVLVHNAGIADPGTVESTSHDEWQRMLLTDVIAVADLTREALPHLRLAHGTVVVINSGSGVTAHAGHAAYCSAKFALRGFTDVLRAEERGRIRVTSVHPGRIDTGMQRMLQADQHRPYDPTEHLRPSDVAATVRLAIDLPWGSAIEELQVRPDPLS